MKAQPEQGQALLLLGWAQKSRVGFSIPVECIGSDPDAPGKPRGKCGVLVMLPDASVIRVTRADLEPAS